MSPTDTDATSVITDYPIPLPVGTRVRSTGYSTVGQEGEMGTVVAHTEEDVTSQGWTSAGEGSLLVRWDEAGINFIDGPGYGETTVNDYVQVVSVPAKVVGYDHDGTAVRIGDTVEYVEGAGGYSDWTGATFEVIGSAEESDNLKFVKVPLTLQNKGYHEGKAVYLLWDRVRVCDSDPKKIDRRDRRGEEFHEGDRFIFLKTDEGSESGWRGLMGTVVRANPDWDLGVKVTVDPLRANGEPQGVINPEPDEEVGLNAGDLIRVGVETGLNDKHGQPLKTGDRVVYKYGDPDLAHGEWHGTIGVVLGRFSNLVAIQVARYKADGTEFPHWDEFREKNANLSVLEMERLEHLDNETETDSEQIGDLTYGDGAPICVGDRVIRVVADTGVPLGTFANVTGATGGSAPSVRVVRDDQGAVTVWGTSYGDHKAVSFDRVGRLIGASYSDGQPICVGDRIVANPGTPNAGRSGTVLGAGLNSVTGLTNVKLVMDDDGSTQGWNPSTISRLQDEDKEKLVEDLPTPTPALDALQEALAAVEERKAELNEAVEEIESKLSDAEDFEPEWTVDEDSVRYAVSVSTSNSELLSLISYDGDGTLSIDDSAVDQHAQETLNVDTSSIEVEITGAPSMSNLHEAFAEGQRRVASLLEAVTEAATLATKIAEGVPTEVAAQVMTLPKETTFTGVIRNARFGTLLPEDAETGPALRFDVVDEDADPVSNHDSSGTQPTRRVRLVGKQIGAFLSTVAVSDVKLLEGRKAVLQQDDLGGFWPTHIGEVPTA